MKHTLFALALILWLGGISAAGAVPVKLKLTFRSYVAWRVTAQLPGGVKTFNGTAPSDGNVLVETTCMVEPERVYTFTAKAYEMNTGSPVPACGVISLRAVSTEGCWVFYGQDVWSSADPNNCQYGATSQEVSLAASPSGILRFKRLSDAPFPRPGPRPRPGPLGGADTTYRAPNATAFEEYDTFPADGRSRAQAEPAPSGATYSFVGDSIGCTLLGGGLVRAGTKSGVVTIKAVTSGCTYYGSITLTGGCGSSGGPPPAGGCGNCSASNPGGGYSDDGSFLMNNGEHRYFLTPEGTLVGYHVSDAPYVHLMMGGAPNPNGTWPAPTDTAQAVGHSSGTIVENENGQVTQVSSDTGVTNIERASDTITISEYENSQITSVDMGVATVSGTPHRITSFSRANSNYDFVITRTEGSNVRTEILRAITGGIETTLEDNVTKVRRTTATVSGTVKELTTETLNNTTTISKTVDTETSYPFGWRTTQRVHGFSGVTETTSYEYYTDSGNSHNYGDLKKL